MNDPTYNMMCIVRGCHSSSVNTPNKYFAPVPFDLGTRIHWFSLLRPGEPFMVHGMYHCCQDHLNFAGPSVMPVASQPVDVYGNAQQNNIIQPYVAEEFSVTNSDTLQHNYWATGNNQAINYPNEDIGPPPKLTKISDLVRNLKCQKKKCTKIKTPYMCVLREKRKTTIDKTVSSNDLNKATLEVQPKPAAMPLTITPEYIDPPIVKEEILEDVTIFEDNFSDKMWNNEQDIEIIQPESSTSHSSTIMDYNESISNGEIRILPYYSQHNVTSFIPIHPSQEKPHILPNTDEFQLQAKHYVHKPMMVDAACQCDIKPIKKDMSCSPIKALSSDKIPSNADICNKKKASFFLVKEVKEEQCSLTQKSIVEENEKKVDGPKSKLFIIIDTKEYIGIDKDKLFIIEEIQKCTNCSISDIKLTLMKIKMNESFSVIGEKFNMPAIQAITVFNQSVDLLADCLKKYIFTPSLKNINRNLPKVFQTKLSNVCVLLDTLEVDIEKPLDPLRPSASKKESKKLCTLKYIISCTPDGFINYVSSGYNSNMSDASLFRECKITKVLPKNCKVITNRKFENIDSVFRRKGCQVTTLPLTTTFEVLEKLPLQERTLRHNFVKTMLKIQEYKILSPNVGLDISFMVRLDKIVTIVSALVNLQRPN